MQEGPIVGGGVVAFDNVRWLVQAALNLNCQSGGWLQHVAKWLHHGDLLPI
jgi:hypothetical protein